MKLKVKFGLFFSALILSLTAGCTKETSKEIETIEFKVQNQEFEILETNDLFVNYLEKVDNTKDAKKLYEKEIIQPIYDSCFNEGEYINMAEDFLMNPPTDLSLLRTNVKNYDSETMIKNIKESITESVRYLQGNKKTTICVIPSKHSINDNDILGLTVGSGKILMYTHLFDSDTSIQSTIAHEYHHSVWTDKYLESSPSDTVLDNIVFEGKAKMFEEKVLGNIAVDMSYDKERWLTIEDDLFKEDFERSLEIIEGNGIELPILYGYSEGYKMIKSYLEEFPDTSIKEWTKLDAKTIYEKGKYKEKYYKD
ncbi:DUF2268 domain-containing putative Zn-dependent protease [Peribacillus sp. NPDC097675]|uniref:DUF2268 domain-containing putative Zn-dependent protease n=1 Tax=Peribacillus sp. NPDC097675 TaxID=3390618 RepID=UPI003CFE7308